MAVLVSKLDRIMLNPVYVHVHSLAKTLTNIAANNADDLYHITLLGDQYHVG